MITNTHTSTVRKQTAAELGKSYYDKRQEVENAQIRQLGAKEALQAASKNNAELIGKITHAWKDNGVIEGFTKEELEGLSADIQKKIIEGQVKWMQRAVGTTDAMVIDCDRAIIMLGGKAKAYLEAEEAAKAVHAEAASQLAAFEQAVESGLLVKDEDGDWVVNPEASDDDDAGGGAGVNSVVGVHPGLTEKQKRLAEEKKEEEAPSEPPPDEPSEPQKRLRPKKTPARKPKAAAKKAKRSRRKKE